MFKCNSISVKKRVSCAIDPQKSLYEQGNTHCNESSKHRFLSFHAHVSAHNTPLLFRRRRRCVALNCRSRLRGRYVADSGHLRTPCCRYGPLIFTRLFFFFFFLHILVSFEQSGKTHGLIALNASGSAPEGCGGSLVCPELSPGMAGICVEMCSSSAQCPSGSLCCSNGCGHTCQPAVPQQPSSKI